MSPLPRIFVTTLAVMAVIAVVGLIYFPRLLPDTTRIPVLVPITGFLSLEGTSQRNGAELALRDSGVAFDVDDTGTAPETAVNAFERALASGRDGPRYCHQGV